MSNYRYISPSVFDRINNLRIIADECNINTDISRSSMPVLGGGFGQVLENIDTLSKKITLKGAILLHDAYEKNNSQSGKYINIGYRSQILNDNYSICDLYNWLTESTDNVYYQYINSLSLNISNSSSISIDMESHSPMLGNDSTGVYFLKPEITILNTGVKSSLNDGALGYLKTARTLKNYDLQIFGINDYISDLHYTISFKWDRINSLPTMPTLGVQYPNSSVYSYYTGAQAPPMELSTLSEISVKMSYTAFINGYYSGSDLENLIGSAISSAGFLQVKLKNNSPLTITPPEMLTSILRKWVYVDQMNFRLINESISVPAEDITKISRTYESTFKTNIFYGQLDPLI